MSARRVGWFLAAWSIGFAMVHLAWALGWRGGVPESSPPISQRPVFLAYDLVAGGLMVGAGLVALALTRDDLSRRTRGRLLMATLIGSVLALLRGGRWPGTPRRPPPWESACSPTSGSPLQGSPD